MDAVAESGFYSTQATPRGLSREEARARLQRHGPNSVLEAHQSLWGRLAAKLWGPVPWLLEAAILLQFMLHEYVEAAVIAVLLVSNAALALQRKAARRRHLLSLGSVVPAVVRPMLMVLLMISGDFLAMSAATDRVRASPHPNAWRIGRVTASAIILGGCNALFCTGMLELATVRFGLTPDHGLRTFAAVTLVFSTQAAFYVVRERRSLRNSRPSAWVIVSSVADMAIISILAAQGILIHSIPWALVGTIFIARWSSTP